MLILQRKNGIGDDYIYVTDGPYVKQYDYDLNFIVSTGVLPGQTFNVQVDKNGDGIVTLNDFGDTTYRIEKGTGIHTAIGPGQVKHVPGSLVVDDTFYYSGDTRRFLSNGALDYEWDIIDDDVRGVYADGSVAFASDNAGSEPIRKYNASGVLQWEFIDYMGDNWHNSRDMRTDAAGNLYAVGRLGISNTPTILRLDVNGANPLVIQPPSSSWFRSIGYDSSGNIYASERDEYLYKFNSSGVLQWKISMGLSTDDIESIAVLPSGFVFVLVDSVANDNLRKYSTDGDLLKTVVVAISAGQDIGIKEFPVTT